MRKGFWKRKMSALLLCAALAAQPSFAAGTRVQAEEGQTVTQAEEGGAAADSVSGGDGSLAAESARAAAGDVTPPVIESFTFQENGQSVERGGELHFTLKAYDLESGIESVYIYLANGKQVGTDDATRVTYSTYMTYNEAEDSYGLTVRTGSLNSRYPAVSWEICYVQWVTVQDKNGNETQLQVGKNGETTGNSSNYLYGCSVKVSASGVKVSISDVTVGDGRESYTAGDEIAVAVAVEGYWGTSIVMRFVGYNENETVSISLSRDDEGIYRGSWTIKENTCPGVWKLHRITVGVENFFMTSSNINVTIEQPDMEPPVIQEISLGESQGKLLKAGDQVDITIRATDNVQLENWASVSFNMVMSNVETQSKTVNLTYDEAAGAYRGSLTVTEDMYPSEWYLAFLYVRDSTGHQASRADAGIWGTGEGAPRHYPYYFRVEQEGVYVEPAENVKITWYGRDEDGSPREVHSKVIENAVRRTTIGALLEGEEVPTEPFHGMDCLGWYTADGRPLDKAEDIVVDPYHQTFVLYMAYDKIPVNVRFKYLDETGVWKTDSAVCLGQEGDFVEELVSAWLEEQDIPKVVPSADGKVKFLEWTQNINYTYGTLDRYYGGIVGYSYTASYCTDYEEPGASAEPGESPAPGATTEPDRSPEPGASPAPGASAEPGASPAPGTTPEPGAASKPNDSPSSGELDRETIEKTAEEIKRAADGAVLKVPMGDATVASEEILKAAKGKDVELVLDMGGYSWTINGRDIKASNPKSIDLKVLLDVDTVPSDVVSAVAGQNYARQVELVHNGDFEFTASLTLNLGAEYSGQNASLYYYDSSHKLIFIQGRTIDGDGNVTMSFSHASNYVIAIEAGEDDTEPDQVQKGNENARPLSPNTGELSGSAAVSVIAGCLLLAAVAAVFLKKRRF